MHNRRQRDYASNSETLNVLIREPRATPNNVVNADEARHPVEFSVESYLENHALKFTGQFDPNCYLYLSRASDLFDLAEHGGSLASGFKRTNLERVLVIGVTTDILFPVHQQRELADGFKEVCGNTEFVKLPCIRGHDSFLVDMDAFRPVICDFFESCP